MSEPAGWQWIEAWLNRTICDEDFASLQKLLREEPDARRTLRRYMAMDTALRDRAEAQMLFALSEAADDPSLVRSAEAPRSLYAWREAVAWSTAAACLLVAIVVWFTRPTTDKSPPLVVQSESPIRIPSVDRREPAAMVMSVAEQRAQLLVSAPDVLLLGLVNSDSGAVAREPGGDIVWSNRQQMGYLRLHGLASNEAEQRQFQLWIIGGDASNNEFINGGMFIVDRNTGELTVPIHAADFVQKPKMFLVSVEPLGGGDALTTSLLAKADGLGL
jgi:anti-sigma-K factor RskA